MSKMPKNHVILLHLSHLFVQAVSQELRTTTHIPT